MSIKGQWGLGMGDNYGLVEALLEIGYDDHL